MSKIKFKNGNEELVERPKYYTIDDCDNGDLFIHNENLYLMVETCSRLIFCFKTNELKDIEDCHIHTSHPVAIYSGEIEVDAEKFRFM